MWNIINFETLRALKKKSFWIASFAPLVLIVIVIGIEYFSATTATNNAAQQTQAYSASAKIGEFDDSGFISPQLLAAQHITVEPSKDAGITAVKSGTLDAFFYYPKDPSTMAIEVYAKDTGISFSPPYNAAAVQLLHQSAINEVSAATQNSEIVQILEGSPTVTATTYKNGVESEGLVGIIAPGIFAAAFLLLFVLLASFMIASTAGEKENRTAEMLLTSTSAETLIAGKVISIFILGLVQLATLAIPLLIALLRFPDKLGLPAGISLGTIPLDPVPILFGALFFATGLLMFTALLVGLGAMFPSATDASRFLGVSIISAFLPIYAITSVISSPHALIVTIFTYFPLTAPTTALLRNAVGSLSIGEALGSLAVIIAGAIVAIWFAVRAFRYGSMEYGRRVGIKELLR
ncbi:MAG TPA: ABC transporter permease [Candidatus Paceibacterota bacterium]|jgi:ABC-2 type transport system permease protein|nr:ABC transporter permease [Candidatus Paceibacterota bacterium]